MQGNFPPAKSGSATSGISQPHKPLPKGKDGYVWGRDMVEQSPTIPDPPLVCCISALAQGAGIFAAPFFHSVWVQLEQSEVSGP